MSIFISLIELIAPGLYIILGAWFLWAIVRWLNANNAYHTTGFELERELAGTRRHSAFLSLSSLGLLLALVVIVQFLVAPRVRNQPLALPTATAASVGTATTAPTALSQETDLLGSGSMGGAPSATAPGTEIPTLTPVGTILSAPPLEGCDKPGAILQIPANGMQVFSPFSIIGTADADSFGSYRIELKGPGTLDSFAVLYEGSAPVTPFGDLAPLTPDAFQPGDYQLRLAVLDTSGILVAACTVNITITSG